MKFSDILRVWAALFPLFPQYIWAKLCTDVLSRDVIQEVEYKEPCIQKYTARCGWLSLNYCTFYHQTYCDKKKNDTVTTYYVVTQCCQGYYRASNGSCLLVKSGDVENSKTTIKPPGYVFISDGGNHSGKPDVQAIKHKVEEKEIEISVGGYAGIICGFIFICAVAFFIIRAFRKRQKRKPRKPPPVATNIEYMATPLPPSPKSTLPETMPLAPPSSLSIAVRYNKNNNQDESCTPLSEGAVETCTPMSEGAVALAEAASSHSEDMMDIKDIPESNV